ncbi:Os11g0649300 [Oryza sativa Japonica Group]|uniref:Os11g0649300 protein n=1 Tax=Oryza sativa subsp. japonica TaxID=39947 RepID=Q0IRC7_ORYSJ|nr:Os11g0649300 [Oryza sativa Japonica Group]|eukprot:NP_001068375.2 Os11g0649300 [Oryza sativa Japonica Group]
MDGVGDGGGGGGPATGGRAGRGGVPDRRPRKSRFSVLASMEDDSAEEELEEYMDDLVRPGSAAFPSDRKWRQGRAEFARRHGHTVAGARTLIRQSVLYSDRPKRSQGRRGRVKPQTESLYVCFFLIKKN